MVSIDPCTARTARPPRPCHTVHQHIRSKSKCPECSTKDDEKAAAKKLASSRNSSFADLTARVMKPDYVEGEVMHGRGIGHWIHRDEVEEEEGSHKSLFAMIRRKLGAGREAQHVEDSLTSQ